MVDRLLRVNEVQERLKIGRTRTYELIQNGELQSLKVGSLRRVPESALQQFIEERMSSASEREAPQVVAAASRHEG
jgi:excisionase family DNA binding protein